MNTFLTHEEIVELTGRKQRTKQVLQLQRMRILFILDALGRPKVLRRNLEDELLGSTNTASAIKSINYSSLESKRG